MSKRQLPPDRVSSYFRAESGVLAVITVTGLLYNIGLVAGPWFEGQMTETLARILLGEGSFSVMASLTAGYIAVIAAVQGLRFLKRFYVRRFANKVNRRMKRVLYGALVRSDREDLEREGAGTVLTKAISDVDDCAEGMRKFTTDEAARPAHRRGLQGAGRGLERRHHGSGGQRLDLPGLWPGGGAPGSL